MEITKEYIEMLYDGTCQNRNGYSLEDCLQDVRGEKMNVVCELLSRMIFNGGDFGSIEISSDGGIRDFFVIYRFGEFTILVKRFCFSLFPEWPFDSAETFALWLNNQEKKILATAVLKVTP